MKFTYKGAGGNDNNFDTEAECEQTCISSGRFDRSNCEKPFELGYCGDHTYYFFISNLTTCEKCRPGECSRNGNNFESFQECTAKCGKPRLSPKKSTTTRKFTFSLV
uniref:BPTI/Kunitz inhibitor domain-containing protein n=1 Tax=Trichobilharzia regenti TaxID=157069 RepID=A0AA85K406_TRIRE|nr:unnamed protein product [Trichobilharzia regenti]